MTLLYVMMAVFSLRRVETGRLPPDVLGVYVYLPVVQ